MKISRKILALLFVVALLIFPAKAFAQENPFSFQGEMWIEADGSGSWEFKISVPQEFLDMGFTLDDLKEGFSSDSSVEVTSAEDLGDGNFRLRVHWQDWQTFMGQEQVVNSDGTITIDLGDLSGFEILTVHVPGNVTQTAGEKKSGNTIVFRANPEGTITYKPYAAGGMSTTTIIWIAVGVIVVLGLIALAVILIRRRKGAGTPTKETRFCSNCGSPIPEGAHFCTNCGKEIGISSPPEEPPSPETTPEEPPTSETTPEEPTAPSGPPTQQPFLPPEKPPEPPEEPPTPPLPKPPYS